MPLTVGELVAYLDLDADPFAKGLNRMERLAQSAGPKMTASLTLPLVAAGAASVKMSLDFEKAFSRMQGLAGVSADEVDGLKESVMGLAGETGKAPQELADALYFIRSAGLAGKDALDALEMSAKGAAAGLGDTVAVADAVTSAMNGYGAEVLSAAKATDVLVTTAREGKVEASELGGQMGRLIPIAAELGISFNDVGAAVAFLSRSNGDASLTATMLSGVMSKLLKPSQMGAEALDEVGLSAERVRELLNENGLSGTMQILRERLGDTGFGLLFDDVQALQGALQMTGVAAEDYIGVAERMGDVTGATEDAFAKWSETMGFKNQQAFADLQVAMIKLGDTLVPLVGKLAEFTSKILEWFSSLDEGSRTMIIALGGFVAAMGPAIMIGGRLVTAVKAIGAAYKWAQVQAGLFATQGIRATIPAGAKATAAFALAAVAVQQYGKMMSDARSEGEEWADSVRAGFNPAKASYAEVGQAIEDLRGKAASLRAEKDDSILGRNFHNKDFNEALEAGADGADEFRVELVGLHAQADTLAVQLGITAAEAWDLANNQDFMADATDTATGAIDDQAAATAYATQELDAYSKALAAMFDPLFGAQDAALNLKEAQDAATAAAKEHGAKSVEAAEANRELVRAAMENEQAMVNLATAISSGEVSLDDSIATLNRWVDQGLITRQAADEQIWAFTVLADKANEVPDEVGIDVKATGVEATLGQIEMIKTAFGNVPKYVPIGFIGPTLPGQERTPGPVYIPPPPTTGMVRPPLLQERASGGLFDPGWLLTGEDGPELMRVGLGGEVFNADTTRQMLNGGGSTVPRSAGAAGGTTTLVVEVPVMLDGRKIGSSTAVIEGMDSERAASDRNDAT